MSRLRSDPCFEHVSDLIVAAKANPTESRSLTVQVPRDLQARLAAAAISHGMVHGGRPGYSAMLRHIVDLATTDLECPICKTPESK